MKKETIKAWAIVEKGYLKNWLPDFAFTGAYALFEDKKKAMLAVEYNRSLMKIDNRHKRNYKIIPVHITPLTSKIRNI